MGSVLENGTFSVCSMCGFAFDAGSEAESTARHPPTTTHSAFDFTSSLLTSHFSRVFTKKGSIFRISPKKDRIVVSSYRRIVVSSYRRRTVHMWHRYRDPSQFPELSRPNLCSLAPHRKIAPSKLGELEYSNEFPDRHAPSFTSCHIHSLTRPVDSILLNTSKPMQIDALSAKQVSIGLV
eukprot:COSAG02_NODE_2782_length_8037_cov_15.993827_3_plen_180_part_00